MHTHTHTTIFITHEMNGRLDIAEEKVRDLKKLESYRDYPK